MMQKIAYFDGNTCTFRSSHRNKIYAQSSKYHEICGKMWLLTGLSGIGKAQLGHLVEAIMRNGR